VLIFATGSGISPVKAVIESDALAAQGKDCRLYWGTRNAGGFCWGVGELGVGVGVGDWGGGLGGWGWGAGVGLGLGGLSGVGGRGGDPE